MRNQNTLINEKMSNKMIANNKEKINNEKKSIRHDNFYR